MSERFYLTTTLPYVNAAPHIGHALEFVQADAIVRYQRQRLNEEHVYFNVGTDEHGLKMYTKAHEQGISPQEYVDKYAAEWQDFCKVFNISYDHFHRTSSAEHKVSAQKFWEQSMAAGDIYKKAYTGLYCVGHESFITEKELVEGKCPDHGTAPVEVAEENYFFRLSKYREHLLRWLDQNPDLLKPASRMSELRNWITDMEDISISRMKENLPWGIDVPGDPEQVMYVWFDALTNYIIAVGYGENEERLGKWWPGTQIFGPDNLRFQGAIWQGMLASVGLPQTQRLLCHGMVLAEDGTKMSKTKGNTVSPIEQQQKYGTDAVRYYLLHGISTYGDSPYVEENLVNLYNSHLADNYGNLYNRVMHVAEKRGAKLNQVEKVTPEFASKVNEIRDRAEAAYERFDIQQASEVIAEVCDLGNKYITEQQPWSAEMDSETAQVVLNNLSFVLQTATELYWPLIPTSAEAMRNALAKQEKAILFPKLELKSDV